MSEFHQVLDHIRSVSRTEAGKSRLFERLIKTYFEQDPLYRDRFADVSLWSDWAAARPGFDRADIGVDLVAEERAGGFCAVQCKCYAPGTRISKGRLDFFISASARDPFTARIVVDTGDEWGPNAKRSIDRLKPECAVLRPPAVLPGGRTGSPVRLQGRRARDVGGSRRVRVAGPPRDQGRERDQP